jgi:hypothetical protein
VNTPRSQPDYYLVQLIDEPTRRAGDCYPAKLITPQFPGGELPENWGAIFFMLPGPLHNFHYLAAITHWLSAARALQPCEICADLARCNVVFHGLAGNFRHSAPN